MRLSGYLCGLYQSAGMKISWSWLSDYLDADIDVNEASDILTSTGLEVETVEKVEPVPGMLAGVVVGKVESCSPHPNADKLQCCQVDVGGEELLPIVCGAPNVAAGQKVLVATVGCTIHPNLGEPFKIKKAKIRGEESRGMICAEDELGLGTDHDGIVVLDPAAEVGMSAALHLGLQIEYVFEIGLTPNRADGMSHLGAARDLVAALNHRKELNLKVITPSVEGFKVEAKKLTVPVEVEDREGCLRYAGVGLTNITVGPSPSWLQERLLSIGIKPTNNVVDVTNFVQHETGQPLHAFDADKIRGGKVVVKTLAKDTRFTTLDEVERKLDETDLMICDQNGGMCIAGVFGGLDSGVSDTTKRVFLESALFDMTRIRKTAKRHGLHTDASFRFERGVDPNGTIYALKRAALLLKEVAGATIASEISDHYPEPIRPHKVTLRYRMLDRMMGHPMSPSDVKSILPMLDIAIVSESDEGLELEVVPYRVDVTREADVIEEIMRIHGFDRVALPEKLMLPGGSRANVPEESLCQAISAQLSSRGFTEIMTPSLVSGEAAMKNGSGAENDMVRMANPLSSELDVMRPDMISGGLAAIAYNLNRKVPNIRFYERGRVYRLDGDTHTEEQRFSLFLSGAWQTETWRTQSRKAELEDVKAELELVLHRSGISGFTVSACEHSMLIDAHEMKLGKRVLGRFGTIRSSVLKRSDVGQDVHYGELVIGALLKSRRKIKLEFEAIPKYPSVRRDLSMLLDRDVRFEDLREAAFRHEKGLLKEVNLFDRFEGKSLPAGKKSYALSFILQDEHKTLTDSRIEKTMEKLFRIYEKEFGAERR